MSEKDLGLSIDQPLTIREQVYKRVSELILSGYYAPTDRLVENQLAKQLGVSRTPIREALHILEMEGFLDAIPRIGYQVKEIRWEDIDEICEIRKINERLAVRWAIEKITPSELKALEDNLNSAERDIKMGITNRISQQDADFHELLVRSSGSKRLEEICQILRRHMFLYRVKSMVRPESALRAIDGHRKILKCFKERDVAGAEKTIEDHLEFVKKDIRQYMNLNL